MIAALPIPTLPDLRSMFSRQLLPLTRMSASPQAGTLDGPLFAGVDKLLSEPTHVSPTPVDVTIEVEIARALGNFEHLTEGARRLVHDTRSLDRAITVILCDKGIKTYLRSSLQTDFKVKRFNLLLEELTSSSHATRARTSSAIASKVNTSIISPVAASLKRKPETGTAAKPSIVHEGQAQTLSTAARDMLSSYLSQTFACKVGTEEHRWSVEALIGALETYESAAQVRAALNGLFQTDLRFLLIKFVELSDSGNVRFVPKALAILKMFAMRLYALLNAVQSAEAIGRSLIETPALFDGLPEGERRRLHDLLARCALRSGRAQEALGKYRDIIARHPDEVGPLASYIAAVYTTDLREAITYSKLILSNQYAASDISLIFIGDLLAHNAEEDLALSAFHRILQRRVDFADAYLGLANLALVKGQTDTWQIWLRRFLQFHRLPAVQFGSETVPAPFSIVPRASQKRALSPKVSVIMTSFNSSDTLELAVRSVLDQTVSNLELFIVDDRSEDNSREIIQALASMDPRIKPIFNDRNMGTYASKNQAIRQCSGDFVTFHDSDDWMHSQRLESHLNAMKHGIACSTSSWIRMDRTGRIIVRRDGPYTHLNPASTFFRRSVLDQVGSFDSVRTGADSEILTRIRHRLGQSAVTHLSDVLAIGLHHEASLTQSGATAFDEHRYSPVRLEYTEAWVKWHIEVLTRDRGALNLNIAPEARPFGIPPQIAS
ncbi:glycosyltransferase [Reyranella sp.]|uniref:glycosyltransferase n=1 Tax=Reyranella sp. TaxID=1929291 RepID=UPI003D128F2E